MKSSVVEISFFFYVSSISHTNDRESQSFLLSFQAQNLFQGVSNCDKRSKLKVEIIFGSESLDAFYLKVFKVPKKKIN